MLENARRQLLLVVTLAAAALILLTTLQPRYGLDLRGGTQLVYELDIAAAQARGDIDANLSPEQVSALVDQTLAIIADRVDPTGQLDPNIVRRGETGILIELPDVGVTEARLIQQRIEELGRLEFRIVATDGTVSESDETDAAGNAKPLFDIAKEKERLQEWLDEPANKELVLENPAAIRVFNSLAGEEQGPISPHLQWFPAITRPNPKNEDVWGRTRSNPSYQDKIPTVEAFDRAADFNGGVVPESFKEKPADQRYLVEFVPINMKEVSFDGDDLDMGYISQGIDQRGRPCINYKMRGEREPDYADWSDKFTDECSAIILNGEVMSAPVFNGRISGPAIIQGDFTRQQVDSLVQVLQKGALQIAPTLQSQDNIGALLGAKSIRLASWSLAIGAALVLAFIIFYYRLAGLVAFISLALNVLLLLGVVSMARTTLTLPGLAGLVLTMGMAVDANILIYERIREELARGKELAQACRNGFEKAIVTVVDANVTTFIAGLVLFNVGMGPIRGFALTLMFGILTTLFTAFFVSRLAFHFLLEAGKMNDFKSSHWLENVHIDFLGKAKTAIALSVLMIVGGLVIFFSTSNDTKYAIDFTGGGNLKVVLAEPMSVQGVKETLKADADFISDYPQPIVNTVGELENGKAQRFAIRIKLTDEQRTAIDQARSEHPEDYEPPYVVKLRHALRDTLVDAPFENEVVDPDEAPNSKRDFAAIDLHFAQPVAANELQQALRSLGGLELLTDSGQPLDGSARTGYRVQFDVPKDTQPSALSRLVQEPLLRADLKTADGEPITLSDPIPESSEIGGRLVGDLRNKAITALLFSLAAIVMFIRVRFHEFSYGLAAVVALVHDVLMTLGFVVLFNSLGWVDCEIDLAMIAAFLTIIGYSINDTIVIFDRVREDLHEQQRLGERVPPRDILNTAINKTLSRTLLTTITTMMVVITLFVVNSGAGTALEGFAFALMIGLLSGTYSTVFIASPVVLTLWKRESARGGHHPVDLIKPREESEPIEGGVV